MRDPNGPPPEQLWKSDIVDGLKPAKPLAQACYEQFKVPGLANVVLTITRSGKVVRAQVAGLFARTPTGACIEAAVLSMHFATFTGHDQTISYPFMLRDARPND